MIISVVDILFYFFVYWLLDSEGFVLYGLGFKLVFDFVVAPVDGAGTVDNQASEEPQASRFTWAIENFSRLNVKKLYSDVFTVGGYKW